MKAYRCDHCGTFRDGTKEPAMKVEWWEDVASVSGLGEIDLCPDCAPAVIAPLEEVAKRDDS